MTKSTNETLLPGIATDRERVGHRTKTKLNSSRTQAIRLVTTALLKGEMTQGQALKRLRIDVLGLKQEEYAKMVKLSRKILSDIENDKGAGSIEVLNKAFKPFGLEVGIVPVSNSAFNALLEAANNDR
ncbi:helix-turn-helix transcriptional regulator [Aliagarivorans taiwanensis]|uniref:helix-turn-helix transcriptional regulator n=1 Tax=Aliagarivorans taiwanensis TaxID=561966 RepID=UPI0006874A3D|nr:helix-turn-helix transcriptional regulator [Aliagarivorans taiwanensis]